MTTDLFPKPRRRMKQPRKGQLREAVESLTDEVIRLRIENERLRDRKSVV